MGSGERREKGEKWRDKGKKGRGGERERGGGGGGVVGKFICFQSFPLLYSTARLCSAMPTEIYHKPLS